MRLLKCLIFVFFLIVLGGFVEAVTCDSCWDCSNKLINKSYDLIELNTSISVSSGSCIGNYIQIEAIQNKIFDCKGYTINGSGTAGEAFVLLSNSSGIVKNNKIQNCIMVGFESAGIYLESLSASSSYNNTFYNNTISDCGTGILFDNRGEFNSFILNNTITSNGYRGIYIENSQNIQIKSNNVSSNKWGVEIVNSSNMNITKNMLNFNKATVNWGNNYGLYIKNSINNAITNNTISLNNCSGTGCWSGGINLFNSSNNTIKRNLINSNKDEGIVLEYSTNNIISNNDLYQNGMSLESSTHNITITNNTLNNSSIEICWAGASGDLVCFNNLVSYNNFTHGKISLDYQTYNNTIKNNEFDFGDFGVDISGGAHDNLILKNTIKNCAGYWRRGIYISSSSEINNTLSNNTIQNCSVGIDMRGVNTTISNNILIDNEKGVSIDTAPNLIYNNYFDNDENYFQLDSSGVNYGNTTKDCTKKNIIGSNCTGGNYYSDFSCVDKDGDGISDSPYSFSSSFSDFLPLCSCNDKIKNAIETDIDCGGNCNKCPSELNCLLDSDCLSGICSSGICVTKYSAIEDTDIAKEINYTANENISAVQFLLFSPPGSDVDLHVYDSSNRHVGHDKYSDLNERGFPASYSGKYTNPEIIYIPDATNKTYRVVAEKASYNSNLAPFINIYALEIPFRPAVLAATPVMINKSIDEIENIDISVVVGEAGCQKPLRNVSVNISDLSSDGNNLNFISLQNQFISLLPACISQGIDFEIELTESDVSGNYSGQITIDSADTGAQTINISVEFVKPLVFEYGNNSYSSGNISFNEGENVLIEVGFSGFTEYNWTLNNQTVLTGIGNSATYNFSADYFSAGDYVLQLNAGNLTKEWNISVQEMSDPVFVFRTATADYDSNGFVYIPSTINVDGIIKQGDSTASHKAVFNVSSDTLIKTDYSAPGYKPDSDYVYFDKRLSTCNAGSDCNLSINEGGYSTSCINLVNEWGSIECDVTNTNYESTFIYFPDEKIVQRINYLQKK